MMTEILHKRCGKPLFLYDIEPVPGERISIKHAFQLNGAPFELFERPYCIHCMSAPGPADIAPGMKIYDMSSVADMQKMHGTEDVA